MRYYSLESGEFNGTLEVKSDELGSIFYLIKADIKPPTFQQVVRFKTELGQKISRSVNFQNTFPVSIELQSKVMSVSLLFFDCFIEIQINKKHVHAFEPILKAYFSFRYRDLLNIVFECLRLLN